MKAVILAGGKGTRLQSSVPNLPKPMAPIGEQPFLQVLLSDLVMRGITDITLSVGYRHNIIMDFFGNSFQGVPVHYVIESSPLGTGGALLKALSRYNSDELVFVFNGDTLIQLDLVAMYQTFTQSTADIGIALKAVSDASRYGCVALSPDSSQVLHFEEKGDSTAGYINAGVYLLRADFFSRFNFSQHFSLEEDCFREKLHDIRFFPFITKGYFIDIGIPDDFRRAQTELNAVLMHRVTP